MGLPRQEERNPWFILVKKKLIIFEFLFIHFLLAYANAILPRLAG